MNSALTFTLVILASMTVAKADISFSKLARYYFWSEVLKPSEPCAQYGSSCINYPCCQYVGHVDMACFSGQCLQTMCGHPGQQCGYGIGECCYHMGLSCLPRGQSGISICTPTGGPVS
ncbi:hypothetical protein BsWGS_26015 [Bradybaena similaris]